MKTKIDRSGWLTSARERRVYWIYFFGQNMIYMLVYMFLATYLLLSGLNPAATAGILVIVKIWDAANDIIFGALIDKAKFKKGGKFIPWLRISLPLIALATLLMFGIPQGFSMGSKLVWFALAYLLWDAAYTISDVPVYGLVTNLTNVQAERTDLMAKSRITAYAGSLLVLLMGFVLPSEQVGMSFTTIAQIVVIIAALTMIWLCIYGREHLAGSTREKSYSLREMFQYFGHNKYLFIYFGGLFMFLGLNTAQAVLQFTCFYLFNNALIATVVAAVSFAPSVLISLFLPLLLRHLDKRSILLTSAIAYTLLSVVIWLIGPILLPHLILSVLRGFALGGVTVVQFMFTPDCAEYGQYKTGVEAKGITFAVQTFTMKLTAAVSGALGIAILGWFGWQTVNANSFAELAALGISQSDLALMGLWTAYALVPMIGGALAVVFWLLYRLKAADVELMARCNNGEISREECAAALSRKY
ncbi:MAG: MFS transporter [Actinomycetia bacterium]|nr:MFS transporter [Actinomycetes bacterium]